MPAPGPAPAPAAHDAARPDPGPERIAALNCAEAITHAQRRATPADARMDAEVDTRTRPRARPDDSPTVRRHELPTARPRPTLPPAPTRPGTEASGGAGRRRLDVRREHWATGDTRERPTLVRAPHRSPGRALASWVAVLLVAVLTAIGLRTFVVESFWIPSASMEPTLHGCAGCNNDRVLVNKTSYRVHAVHRGDVVVFDKPAVVDDPDKYLIKRVIGLPGDVVSGHDGSVWIGNRPLDEPYVNPACGPQEPFAPITVPDDEVLVLGDNRCNSFDGRLFGTIAEETILGRAFVIIWPVERRHWL
jgi:signal peptidase I